MGTSDSISALVSRYLNSVQSYGGFMSCKVVEADAGVHSLAMAVAVRTPISQRKVSTQLIS